MRQFVKIAVAFIVGAVGGWCAHHLVMERGSVAATSPVPAVQSIRAESDFARFGSLAAALRAYLREHDGWIPADPYRAMVESGKVDSFQVFVNAKVSFDIQDVPVRVDPVPEHNARGILFSAYMDYLDEVWICYTDGTKGRCSAAEAGGIMQQWHATFHKAGNPGWGSVRDKAKWIDEHRGTLVWNPQLKMYVIAE